MNPAEMCVRDDLLLPRLGFYDTAARDAVRDTETLINREDSEVKLGK